MTDGGAVPAGIMKQAYHGAGAYVDYEQVRFQVEDLVRNNSDSPDSNSRNVDPLFEASELLDRREEMADIIHAEMELQAACVLEDDAVVATQRDVSKSAVSVTSTVIASVTTRSV